MLSAAAERPERAPRPVVASVKDLVVHLRLDRSRARSLREYCVAKLKRVRSGAERVEVLSGISFEVERGGLLAVVGPNGAGKTTLLRVLAGVVPPAAGRVRVEGRVAPLIELGAGLDPELTGRENIALYGSMLGMGRAGVAAVFEDIVEFSGLAGSLDMPVRAYSSGMAARLGFAVAVHSDPQLLLIDEVLAVGDEAFRSSCLAKIDELRSAGAAVVLVSHDRGLVERFADHAIYVNRGRLLAAGDPAEVLGVYAGVA